VEKPDRRPPLVFVCVWGDLALEKSFLCVLVASLQLPCRPLCFHVNILNIRGPPRCGRTLVDFYVFLSLTTFVTCLPLCFHVNILNKREPPWSGRTSVDFSVFVSLTIFFAGNTLKRKYEHSEPARAPHTNGRRDVPRVVL
jgi:hypothetical protein